MKRGAVLAIAIAVIAGLSGCNKQGVIDESSLGSPPSEGSMVPATPADDGMAGMDMGDASIPPDAETYTVRATEYSFEPTELAVPAGKPLAVTLVNAGRLEHDWVLTDGSGREVPGAHLHAAAGTEATAVFELDAGTYEFRCTVPGHAEAGMTGTLTVN